MASLRARRAYRSWEPLQLNLTSSHFRYGTMTWAPQDSAVISPGADTRIDVCPYPVACCLAQCPSSLPKANQSA
eukprot:3683199-Pyramimonas_sp.AAC.2